MFLFICVPLLCSNCSATLIATGTTMVQQIGGSVDEIFSHDTDIEIFLKTIDISFCYSFNSVIINVMKCDFYYTHCSYQNIFPDMATVTCSSVHHYRE